MITYIISQIFVIISYGLLSITYFSKNRKKVLLINFASIVANAIAFVLLGAWSGFIMSIVAMLRNIIFLSRKNNKNIEFIDWIILLIFLVISVVSAVYTYEGIFSLFSIFGTMIYTYSVWQKSTVIYKVLGIPTSVCWIIYNIYVDSIFGIVLETLLLVSEIIGIKKVRKTDK